MKGNVIKTRISHHYVASHFAISIFIIITKEIKERKEQTHRKINKEIIRNIMIQKEKVKTACLFLFLEDA
jgi:hypothetical protein